MFTFLFIVGILTLVWFIIEIIRLEGWPGRKWHHAYIGIVLEGLGWWIITKNQHSTGWVIFGCALIAFGVWLVVDDAGQHNEHNRMKRMGVPRSQWRTSWFHRNYEKVIRDLCD